MTSRIASVFILIVLLAFGGCSSKSVKHEVREVKTMEPGLTATVLQEQPSEETIDPRAYHYYVNGLLYEGIGNLPKAASSFKSALKYHPDSYQLRYSLAETYYHLRRYDQTISTLAEISPEDADVHLLRGAAYASLGMDDLARESYLRLIELDPGSSMAYSHLAGYYRQRGQIDSLIWAYESLARTRPDNERIWRELGRIHAQQGDYAAAREAFQKSIDIRSDQTNIVSYLGLAELHQIDDNLDSAIMAYQAALDIEPSNVVANRELVSLMVRQDSLGAALPYARRVVEATPLDRDAVRRLGIIYFGLDSLDTADSILTYLIESGERHSANHYYLGQVCVRQGDFQRAVEQFTVLTQLADTLSESWLDLGYAYQKMQKFDKAILTYQTGLGRIVDDAGELKLLFALGAAYEQSDQVEKAVATFEEIIARAPNHSAALNYLGYMLADRGERLEYAKQLIEKAVELSPENAAYLDSYGWVYFRLQKYEEALVHLKKAVELEADPIIYDHLGDAYEAVGDADNARVWWEKALELDPENSTIKKKLGH